MAVLPIVGWYGRRNCGDEAFKDVHKLMFPDLEMEWNRKPAALQESGVALVSAGDIVNPFYFDEIPASKKLVIYGVGLAAPDQIELLQARRKQIMGIWVRNPGDAKALQEAGLPGYFTPDIVFSLKGAPTEALMPGIVPPKTSRKRVIVTLSDSPRGSSLRQKDMGKFFSYQSSLYELADSVDYLAKYYEVVIVPFSFDKNDYDLAAIFDLMPRLRDTGGIHVIEQELTPLQMIEFFKTADLVVSVKFHGVVFALLNEIPFIGVSDTRKVKNICSDNGLGELWMPLTGFRSPQFKDVVLKAAESDETKAKITALSSKLYQEAKAAADQAASLVRQAMKDNTSLLKKAKWGFSGGT